VVCTCVGLLVLHFVTCIVAWRLQCISRHVACIATCNMCNKMHMYCSRVQPVLGRARHITVWRDLCMLQVWTTRKGLCITLFMYFSLHDVSFDLFAVHVAANVMLNAHPYRSTCLCKLTLEIGRRLLKKLPAFALNCSRGCPEQPPPCYTEHLVTNILTGPGSHLDHQGGGAAMPCTLPGRSADGVPSDLTTVKFLVGRCVPRAFTQN
jgi:hypothetical protein